MYDALTVAVLFYVRTQHTVIVCNSGSTKKYWVFVISQALRTVHLDYQQMTRLSTPSDQRYLPVISQNIDLVVV